VTVVALAVVAVTLMRRGEPELADVAEVRAPRPAQPASTAANDPGAPPEPGRAREFFDLLARARQAAREGEPEEALQSLEAARSLAGPESALADAATAVERTLLAAAEEAMVGRQWQRADLILAAALDLTSRFALGAGEVDEAIDRLAAAEWLHVVEPVGIEELRAVIDHEVELTVAGRQHSVGVVRAVDSDAVTLEVKGPVAGGAVVYDASIDLATITTLRYTLPADPQRCTAARERAAAHRSRPRLVEMPAAGGGG
jgi:hypothetical protein